MRALIREWIIPFYALTGVVGLMLYGVLLVDPGRVLATWLLLALVTLWAFMLATGRSHLAARSALFSRPALVFVGLTLLMYAIGFAFTGVGRPGSIGAGRVITAGDTPAAAGPNRAPSPVAVTAANFGASVCCSAGDEPGGAGNRSGRPASVRTIRRRPQPGRRRACHFARPFCPL